MKTMSKWGASLQNQIYYYVSLSIIVLTYGLNLWLNVVLYLVFTINILANIRKNRFLFTFFALVIFEPQLHSTLVFAPIMLSSLVKVYYIAFAIRVVLDILKKSTYKMDWSSALLALIFIVTSFSYATSVSSGALYMLKTAAVMLYMIFYLGANAERDEMLGEMLSMIALFMLLSGVYGLTRNLYWDNRLCSTIQDPNYSAMYFAMGLMASFNASIFKKWLKTLISLGLVVLMIMTMSLTGIALTMLVLVIYFFVTQGIKRVAIVIVTSIILVGGILIVPSKPESKLERLQERVSKVYVIDETDYTFEGKEDYSTGELYFNYVTNNRYYLVRSYMGEYRALPIKEQLFGGNNVMTGDYRDEMVEKYTTVSHNTYIDMMYMVGLIPMLMITVLLLWRIVSLVKEYRRTKSRQVLSILFVKLIILVFGFTLSFFSYRYFIVFSLF